MPGKPYSKSVYQKRNVLQDPRPPPAIFMVLCIIPRTLHKEVSCVFIIVSKFDMKQSPFTSIVHSTNGPARLAIEKGSVDVER